MYRLMITSVMFAAACVSSVPVDDENRVDQASATSCSIVPSYNAGTAISVQQSGPVISSAFTRKFVPVFFRPGPWTGGLFVQDAAGLTMPAVTSAGSASAWMIFPMESGETINGFSVTACGDSKSVLNVDTFGTHTDSNPTDHLVPSGSGGPTNNSNVWLQYNVPMVPTTMHQDSVMYASVTAASVTEATPGEAVSSITVYYDR